MNQWLPEGSEAWSTFHSHLHTLLIHSLVGEEVEASYLNLICLWLSQLPNYYSNLEGLMSTHLDKINNCLLYILLSILY